MTRAILAAALFCAIQGCDIASDHKSDGDIQDLTNDVKDWYESEMKHYNDAKIISGSDPAIGISGIEGYDFDWNRSEGVIINNKRGVIVPFEDETEYNFNSGASSVRFGFFIIEDGGLVGHILSAGALSDSLLARFEYSDDPRVVDPYDVIDMYYDNKMIEGVHISSYSLGFDAEDSMFYSSHTGLIYTDLKRVNVGNDGTNDIHTFGTCYTTYIDFGSCVTLNGETACGSEGEYVDTCFYGGGGGVDDGGGGGGGGGSGGGGGDGGGGSEGPQPPETPPDTVDVSKAAYERLNFAEKLLCASEWTLCAVAGASAHGAEVYVAGLQEQIGLPPKCNCVDNWCDAIRHIVWQASLTNAVDAFYAELWGDAHEAFSSGPGKDMDLANNATGRNLASQYGSDYILHMWSLVKSGQVATIKTDCT